MEFFEVLHKRRSVRKFSEKTVEKEKLDKILEMTNKAPSAGNLQSYEIFVVHSKDKQKQMVALARKQTFLEEASYILVFCANPKRAAKYGPRGENLYAIQDAAIACTYAHLCAVELGLSSVWVGAFNEESIQNLLGLPENLRPVAMLPIGYAADNPAPTPRRGVNDLVKYIE